MIAQGDVDGLGAAIGLLLLLALWGFATFIQWLRASR
jgi:hypothetical protein